MDQSAQKSLLSESIFRTSPTGIKRSGSGVFDSDSDQDFLETDDKLDIKQFHSKKVGKNRLSTNKRKKSGSGCRDDWTEEIFGNTSPMVDKKELNIKNTCSC